MLIKKLKTKPVPTKKFRVQNLYETFTKVKGGYLENNVFKQANFISAFTFENGIGAKKLLQCDGNVFLCSKDNYIYKKEENKFRLISLNEYNIIPTVFSAKNMGETVTVINQNGSAIIVGNTVDQILMPNGVDGVLIDGMLYLLTEKGVYYGEFYNYSCFDESSDKMRFIRTNTALGKCLRLIKQGERLFVLHTNGITELIIDSLGETVKIVELAVRFDGVNENTLAVDGQVAVFGCGSEFYKFSNGTLSRINFNNLNKEFTPCDTAMLLDGKYLLPIKTAHGNFIAGRDLVFQTEFYIPYQNKIFSTFGSYIDTVTGEFGTLSFLMEFQNNKMFGEIKSDEITFDSVGNKTLSLVTLCVTNPCTLTVKGDSCTNSFNLVSGYNEIKTNVVSTSFVLKLSNLRQGEQIQDLTIYYKTKGGV